jgi:Tol biopolymer transport system component
VNPLGSQSNRPWKRLAAASRALALISLAAAALAALLVPVRAGFAQNPASGDTLVYELAGNRWFEFPGTIVSLSSDASSAIFFGGLGHTQLIALPSGRPDPETLRGGLDRLLAAGYCGPQGFLRLGSRGTESGIFWPGRDGPELSTLPSDAVPTCSPDGKELAYYTLSAADRTIYIGTRGAFRSYSLGGSVTSMAFSPDGNMFYDIVFQPNGESVLGRIEVPTGKTRTIAAHLDAAPDPGKIAITPDGNRAFIALAGDGPPNNEARHNPQADRWLKIYEINLSTGARRRVVESSGQDVNDPSVANGSLYYARTVIHNSVVAVPFAGGDAKEVVEGGQVPMWSPDGKRIAYTFGGWRLADWALNLDDAVIDVDENARPVSQPFVIVSGYHEDFPPAWSPDGKWIAFHSHRSPKPVPEYSSAGSTDDVYLRRAENVHAPEIRLTDFGWETGPAYWSPDGQKLLFSSWQRGGEPGIDKLFVLTMDTETGAALKADMLPLPAAIRSAQWAAWSPDGTEIAIEDNRGGTKRALWIVHADGSHQEKLTDYEGTSYGGLDWTHDGKAVIFAALAGERLQLFSELRAGGDPRQLTHDSGNLMHPRVSPDGRWIACTRIVESKQIYRRPL